MRITSRANAPDLPLFMLQQNEQRWRWRHCSMIARRESPSVSTHSHMRVNNRL
jgi:hypothetical protein